MLVKLRLGAGDLQKDISSRSAKSVSCNHDY